MFKNPLEQFDVILFFTNFGYLKSLILISIFIFFLYIRYKETEALPTRKGIRNLFIFFAIIHFPTPNFAIMTFIVLAIFSFFFKKQLRHRVPFFVKFIPFLFNQLFYFIKTTLKDNLSIRKKSFIFLMYILFIFTLLGNLFGMLPYSITITSHFIFTLYYSLAFFIGINIIGILYQDENYFILFLPEGVPI
jgi:F0F1-type ATP synthase membrane subunit a